MECICAQCDDEDNAKINKDSFEDTSFCKLNNEDIMSLQPKIKQSFFSSLDSLYNCTVNNANSLPIKALLIKSSALAAFFSSKQNFLNYSKPNVNYYYNHVVVSNYLSKHSITFVIVQDEIWIMMKNQFPVIITEQ